MKRLAVLSVPFFLSTPAMSADFDGPVYREREAFIERDVPPPRVVEHYHYYVPAPVYRERVYDEPRVYRHYDRPFYAYSAYRPRHHYFPRWHHHRGAW